MGSKSSKWLAAILMASALAVVPAGAIAKLDYSKNSVSGQYLPSSASLVPQINDVSTPTAAPPVAPKVTTTVVHTDPGFSWGDALIGAGVALMLAAGGIAVARRRHPSPLVS
jgi:hypothetical protein